MCALAFGVLLAGCGKAGYWVAPHGARPERTTTSSSSGDSKAPPATASTPSASPPKTTGSTGSAPLQADPPARTDTKPDAPKPSVPTVPSPNPARQQALGGDAAVASCRRGLQAAGHVDPSTRRKLEAICRHATDSNPQAKRKAAQEACRVLVQASPLPPGTSRERALATCANGA
jgi:hypothetical protein